MVVVLETSGTVVVRGQGKKISTRTTMLRQGFPQRSKVQSTDVIDSELDHKKRRKQIKRRRMKVIFFSSRYNLLLFFSVFVWSDLFRLPDLTPFDFQCREEGS